MNKVLKFSLLCWLLPGLLQPALALELFGVNLEATSRDELRDAAKRAGVILIREGSADIWFDAYDSSAVLAGSSQLYLGFVKADLRFAFAEYEFKGIHLKRLLRDLEGKYGKAITRRGSFISDNSYSWKSDGIEISLSSNWHNYRTRLVYIDPANMADLVAERAKAGKGVAAKPAYSVY